MKMYTDNMMNRTDSQNTFSANRPGMIPVILYLRATDDADSERKEMEARTWACRHGYEVEDVFHDNERADPCRWHLYHAIRELRTSGTRTLLVRDLDEIGRFESTRRYIEGLVAGQGCRIACRDRKTAPAIA